MTIDYDLPMFVLGTTLRELGGIWTLGADVALYQRPFFHLFTECPLLSQAKFAHLTENESLKYKYKIKNYDLDSLIS